MGTIDTYVGTCNLCGEEVSVQNDRSEGIVDVVVDEDYQVWTALRHIGGPKPECEIYSFPARLVETSTRSTCSWPGWLRRVRDLLVPHRRRWRR